MLGLGTEGNGMKVMSAQCRSCIYRGDSPLHLDALEAEVHASKQCL